MTAVEWLVNHWKKLQSEGEKMSWNQIIEITQLAKQMEKEQIIDIVEKSRATGLTAEYLLLTYGSNGSDDHIVDTNEMVCYTEEQVREVIRNCFKSNSLGFLITEDDMMRTIKKDKI